MLQIKVIVVEVEDFVCLKVVLDVGYLVDLLCVGLFVEGVVVKCIGDEMFCLCQEYLDDIIIVDSDVICVVMKDLFEDVWVVVEFFGVLVLVGMKKYIVQYNICGECLVYILFGVNVNFYGLCYVFECCEFGEQWEVLLVVMILEEKGSFLKFCQLLGGCLVMEFNYCFVDVKDVCIFVGVCLSCGLEEWKEIFQLLNDGGYSVVDFFDDEMVKLYVCYMVGGWLLKVLQEWLFSFEFLELLGVLLKFLYIFGIYWNILLFYYCSYGIDYGWVLVVFELGEYELDFEICFNELGYECYDEMYNLVFCFFFVGQWLGRIFQKVLISGLCSCFFCV